MEIVRDEEILGGDPRIAGTRIGVHHVYELVVEGEHSPEDTADQLDCSLGAVYTALAYCYEHPDELRAVRRRHADVRSNLDDQSLDPKEIA
jgi:uncharacterized protein (DUF433 family)